MRAAYSILDLDADLKRAADAQIRTGGYEHGGPSSFSGSNHRASTSNMKNQSEGSERSRSNIYAGGRQETSEPGVERREIHMCRQTRAGGEEGVLRDHVRRIAVVMAKVCSETERLCLEIFETLCDTRCHGQCICSNTIQVYLGISHVQRISTLRKQRNASRVS